MSEDAIHAKRVDALVKSLVELSNGPLGDVWRPALEKLGFIKRCYITKKDLSEDELISIEDHAIYRALQNVDFKQLAENLGELAKENAEVHIEGYQEFSVDLDRPFYEGVQDLIWEAFEG